MTQGQGMQTILSADVFVKNMLAIVACVYFKYFSFIHHVAPDQCFSCPACVSFAGADSK